MVPSSMLSPAGVFGTIAMLGGILLMVLGIEAMSQTFIDTFDQVSMIGGGAVVAGVGGLMIKWAHRGEGGWW